MSHLFSVNLGKFDRSFRAYAMKLGDELGFLFAFGARDAEAKLGDLGAALTAFFKF